MRNPVLLLIVLLLLRTIPASSQSVAAVSIDQLTELINQPNDTLYVVNFWATWCAPCVQELPEFEAVRLAYTNRKVAMLLVSMDNPKELKGKVIPFVRNRKIRSRVVLLNETDANVWIDKIAPEWSGALPMTLVINTKRNVRQFINKPLKQAELTTIINQYKPD